MPRISIETGSARGRPVYSILISVAVHVVLIVLLALALSGVARHGVGSVVSLDLGAGPSETASFEAPSVQAEASEVPTTPEDAAAIAAQASAGLTGAIARVNSATVDAPRGAVVPRGAGKGSAPLLERGPAVGGMSNLSTTGMTPTLDGASFAGVRAKRARSVVYAVDASGAMITSLPFVLDELRRSVSALAADQKFAVVLFGRRAGEADASAGVRPFPDQGMRSATPASKAEFFAWLDEAQARGASNPLDGLLSALDREPEVVFLLSRSIRRTDGRETAGDWGPGREAILAELERANPVRKSIFGPPARAVQVKCVQFLEEDPSGVMQAIAEVHGGGAGSYRLLPESELRRR
ncbi:MAG: hypothetical protein NCW75_03585 [Phycisphaera sp.]|nr:MAG: hypothetical protein NCW75_03585 [Phycisphaera sp.]